MGMIRFKTPEFQTFLMGIVFMFTFTSYITIQAFASKMYGDTLGSNESIAVYAVFTIACFISPVITNKLGCKLTMFFGVLGYSALVGFSLIYFELNESKKYDFLVILGGAILGFGAALLWTAQGRLILEYSNGTSSGRLFSIFWGLFNVSALIGGILTFVYFSKEGNDAGSTTLYIIFFVLVIAGACSTLCLERPENLEPSSFEDTSKTENENLLSEQTRDSNQDDDTSNDEKSSWWGEMFETLVLFKTKRMALLSLIFWYTGFNQPYQLVTFGDRFFNSKTLGLEMIVFYGFEILGSFAIGRFLDDNSNPNRPKRQRAKISLFLFFLITGAGNIVALILEKPHIWARDVAEINYDSPRVIAPTFAFALWGLSDSQIQTYAYWLMGTLYRDGKQQARAVGFYKMVQSAGWCAGFAFVPVNRVPPIIQLGLTIFFYVAGSFFALLELPLKTNQEVNDLV